MAEVHVTIPASGGIVFHNPASNNSPLPASAAKPVTATKDATGKVTTAHGQVSTGSTVQGPVFDSPA